MLLVNGKYWPVPVIDNLDSAHDSDSVERQVLVASRTFHCWHDLEVRAAIATAFHAAEEGLITEECMLVHNQVSVPIATSSAGVKLSNRSAAAF